MSILKPGLFRIRRLLQLLLCSEVPARLWRTVEFPHPVGVIIDSDVRIGTGVAIYHHVTIGRKAMDREHAVPTIGNNVIIYPGSVIVGDITIGDNCIVGAHAIVDKSVPAGSLVVGHNRIVRSTKA